MREDIAKVIVERPRRGSRYAPNEPKGWKKRFGKDCDIEDLPTKESMSAGRKHGYDAKELNENLNPLRRFLEKSVGRPWDKVFAELSEQIDMNSTVKRHIWQHVFDTVEKNTFIGPDGQVWTCGNYGGADHPLEYSSYGGNLYIHPVDGLLKRVKKPKGWKPYKWKRNDRKDTRKDGPNGTQFHKVNGIWYIAQLKPLPSGPLATIVVTETLFFGTDKTKKYETSVPTADGKIYDVMLNRQLYTIFNEKIGKEISFSYSVKVPSNYKNDNHWSSSVYKGKGNDPWVMTTEETLTSLYGRRAYAISFKQANGKELKAVDLKNDPPLTEAQEKEAKKKAGK
jgi:hypothetical protein